MELFLAVLLKPFVAFVMFALAFIVAHFIGKIIPEGRIKRILFSPLPWLDKSRRRR